MEYNADLRNLEVLERIEALLIKIYKLLEWSVNR